MRFGTTSSAFTRRCGPRLRWQPGSKAGYGRWRTWFDWRKSAGNFNQALFLSAKGLCSTHFVRFLSVTYTLLLDDVIIRIGDCHAESAVPCCPNPGSTAVDALH